MHKSLLPDSHFDHTSIAGRELSMQSCWPMAPKVWISFLKRFFSFLLLIFLFPLFKLHTIRDRMIHMRRFMERGVRRCPCNGWLAEKNRAVNGGGDGGEMRLWMSRWHSACDCNEWDFSGWDCRRTVRRCSTTRQRCLAIRTNWWNSVERSG